jgi:peptidoglycan hydrolase CwlO-like protein
MSSTHRWGWAVPALLAAAACMAQAPSKDTAAARKQLQQIKQEVSRQQAQAGDLEQQIKDAKQRNVTEQAHLAERDREIARLKAQLTTGSAATDKKPASSASSGGH